MGAPSIDFWFSSGSTCTHLTVGRIDSVAKAAGVTISWRPFRNALALTGGISRRFPKERQRRDICGMISNAAPPNTVYPFASPCRTLPGKTSGPTVSPTGHT